MNLTSLFPSRLLLLFLPSVFVLPLSAQSGAAATGAQSVSPESPSQAASHPVPNDEFAQMDTNGDGRVSAEEYTSSSRSALDRIAAGKRGGAAGPTGGFEFHNNEGRPDRSKFFRELDVDRDGYLNRNELGFREPSAGRGKDTERDGPERKG